MGGSGGGSYFPAPSEKIRAQLERAREEERRRLEANVVHFLQELLAKYNQRDADALKSHLERVGSALGERYDVLQFLLGGSVARHTFVDGLSDVDALVILDREDLVGQPPSAVIAEFKRLVSDSLTRDVLQRVTSGRLAVTVEFRDGIELQLLPALRSGSRVTIPDAAGEKWKEVAPKRFQTALTRANDAMNGSLVPAIKLVKSLLADVPEPKRITGYHVEALALDAVSGYTGDKTPKALLLRVLEHACSRVLRPIRDVTGQSATVDQYLGRPGSPERRNVSYALAALKTRLEAATTVDQWRKVLGDRMVQTGYIGNRSDRQHG